jgi:multidrug efflux pump subunit AcrA (membrane-fusion protein)
MLAINPPEKELARLKEGQVAKATIDALGDEEFEARVRRINPGVESSTGTVKVILDVDPAIRKRLREAAFARVRLVMETHENALLVPKDALVEENARKYLFVVQKGEAKQPDQARTKPEGEASAPETKVSETEQPNQDTGSSPESPVKEPEQAEMRLVAERVEVQAGLEDSASVEILSGVDDNSLVVTVGQHTLKSGSAVKVTNATDEILAKSGLSAEDALKAAKEKRAGEDQTRKRPPLHREHRH